MQQTSSLNWKFVSRSNLLKSYPRDRSMHHQIPPKGSSGSLTSAVKYCTFYQSRLLRSAGKQHVQHEYRLIWLLSLHKETRCKVFDFCHSNDCDKHLSGKVCSAPKPITAFCTSSKRLEQPKNILTSLRNHHWAEHCRSLCKYVVIQGSGTVIGFFLS